MGAHIYSHFVDIICIFFSCGVFVYILNKLRPSVHQKHFGPMQARPIVSEILLPMHRIPLNYAFFSPWLWPNASTGLDKNKKTTRFIHVCIAVTLISSGLY